MNKVAETKSVYVLLTDTGTLFTKTIKRYTAAPYNHVSISLDSELNELYSFGRKIPTNPVYAGFVKENVYGGTYRHFPNTKCIVLKLQVNAQQLDKIKEIIRSFQEKQAVYKYNVAGLFGVIVNYPIEIKNAYFCSQFVAEVLKKAGIQLWDKPSALVTPNEFLQHSLFKTVYEGPLYEYPRLKSRKLLSFESRMTKGGLLKRPYNKLNSFLVRMNVTAIFSLFV